MDCELLTPTQGAMQQSVDCESPTQTQGATQQSVDCESLTPTQGATQQSRFKDCPGFLNSTRRLGPKRGRKCYVTPAFSGVPNKGDKIRSQNLH